MATLAITIANGENARARLDRLSSQIRELAQQVPDVVTGGATTLTIDNAPSTGVCSVQITSGPHTSSKKAQC